MNKTFSIQPHSLAIVAVLAILMACPCYGQTIYENTLEPRLIAAAPLIGSVNCSGVAWIQSPACPHVIATPDQERGFAFSEEVSPYRVLRLIANERLYGWLEELKPLNPHRTRDKQRGFSANLVVASSDVSLHMNLQSQDINWRLFGGAVRPFNKDDPYAVMRLSWHW